MYDIVELRKTIEINQRLVERAHKIARSPLCDDEGPEESDVGRFFGSVDVSYADEKKASLTWAENDSYSEYPTPEVLVAEFPTVLLLVSDEVLEAMIADKIEADRLAARARLEAEKAAYAAEIERREREAFVFLKAKYEPS